MRTVCHKRKTVSFQDCSCRLRTSARRLSGGASLFRNLPEAVASVLENIELEIFQILSKLSRPTHLLRKVIQKYQNNQNWRPVVP